MKKLTTSEVEVFEATNPLRRGSQKSAHVVLAESLEVGEGMFLPKEEWTRSTNPAASVYTMGIKLERKYRSQKTAQGWFFKRIK